MSRYILQFSTAGAAPFYEVFALFDISNSTSPLSITKIKCNTCVLLDGNFAKSTLVNSRVLAVWCSEGSAQDCTITTLDSSNLNFQSTYRINFSDTNNRASSESIELLPKDGASEII